MRINIISPEFPPDIGGVETYAFEFTKELARRGHEITVFTQRHAQGEVSLPGVVVRPVLTQRRNLDRRILSDHVADVWHAMNAGYAWLALDGKRTVVSVHGNDFLRPYVLAGQYDPRGLPFGWRFSEVDPAWLKPFWLWRTRRLLSRALPQVKHIVTNSRYTEEAFLKLHPGCRGKTSVGYSGVAERFFSMPYKPSADGVRRLLTVCRLAEPRKNVNKVIRALAALKDGYAFRYTVIGDGHNRQQLQRLAEDLGLGDRVHFTGFVSQDDLLRAYSESDLFVLTSSVMPSSHEGFGTVYLEAAASGVPSLAARMAGAAEAVKDGVSGMFVETPTVDAIATALKRFLDGTMTFDREACRHFAEGFSWQRVVDHALQYYV
jgi:phosphatidylinositol alpha-1,6-mannosyltransferase